MSANDFDDLWSEVNAASDKELPRAIHAASEKYDDLTLECKFIPDEGFDFLLKMLSDTRVMRTRGMAHFLLEVNVDFCKYTPQQQTRLLTTLLEKVGVIADELVRHSVGDLIARAYSPDQAADALMKLAGGNSLERHAAFVGLDVLIQNESIDKPIRRRIEAKWLELQQSQ
ncbi:hypothetical protein ACTJKJ_24795 [Roseateles sp. 22389]|uniref:hypothetical protein n=1 Tax=Roseateles sp. 22389 TaxID=3453916 RepID=UPI003F83C42A